MTRAPRVTADADTILRQVDILGNPYFRDLQAGSMSLEIFRWTQEQFYFIVVFFARPMAALVARIPDPRSRSDILHNLVEEHGDFRSEDYHESTIRQFVQTLGGTIDLETLRPCPAVYALNNLLLGTCTLDELEVGISCLGMIEYAFMHISATIAQTVIQRGWVTPERLTHYALHAEIDERHAEEFFAVVEPRWEEPERRLFIVQGLELGAYVWDRLYRDLYISACSALVPSPPATAAR